MRNSLFILALTVINFVNFLSCSTNSSNNDEVSNEVCFKFIDKETNLPIEGLGINMHVERPSGVDLTIQGSTDENGDICKYSSSSLGGITYFQIQNPTDKLYWSPFCTIPYGESVDFPSSVYYLSPTAYIRFHIQSFIPENDEDYLYIQYNFLEVQGTFHPYHCQDGFIINEIQSDTVFIKNTRAGSNTIVWEKNINNAIVNSNEQSMTISAGDTLNIEIIHQ